MAQQQCPLEKEHNWERLSYTIIIYHPYWVVLWSMNGLPSGYVKQFAIENDPVEIVDLPS